MMLGRHIFFTSKNPIICIHNSRQSTDLENHITHPFLLTQILKEDGVSLPPFLKLTLVSIHLFILHFTEYPIYIFLEIKLLGLIPNSYIHVSLRNLQIPRIGLLFGCSKIGRPILGIYRNRSQIMYVEIGRQNIIILFWK